MILLFLISFNAGAVQPCTNLTAAQRDYYQCYKQEESMLNKNESCVTNNGLVRTLCVGGSFRCESGRTKKITDRERNQLLDALEEAAESKLDCGQKDTLLEGLVDSPPVTS